MSQQHPFQMKRERGFVRAGPVNDALLFPMLQQSSGILNASSRPGMRLFEIRYNKIVAWQPICYAEQERWRVSCATVRLVKWAR
jgi:hypothetical protein